MLPQGDPLGFYNALEAQRTYPYKLASGPAILCVWTVHSKDKQKQADSAYVPLVALMYLNQPLKLKNAFGFQRTEVFHVSCCSFSLGAMFDKYNCSFQNLLQITKCRKMCLFLTINKTRSLISSVTQCSWIHLIYMNSTIDFVL